MAPRALASIVPLVITGCLIVSCESPRKKALRELSRHGVEPSGQALLDAVKTGDAADAKLLLQAGVQTGQRDENGRTPLHLAIESHDVATSARLLEAGSDPNALDKSGASVLGYALAAGDTALADRLLQTGAKSDGLMPGGETILPWAIREGRLAFLSHAMQAGGDPHLTDKDGNSLVQVAMRAGRHDIVGVLLERGADAAPLDSGGASLLHQALDRGWTDLIPRLLKAGADPNAADSAGRTPVDEAVLRRDPALLGQLLAAGGDPTHPDPAGETPLARILQADWPEGRQLLAKNGVDFNQPDAKGKTPLTRAMETGNCELAQEIIGYGAKEPEGGWAGWMSRALRAGDSQVVHHLVSMGVPVDRHDQSGLMPVELATVLGNGSMVRALLDAGAPAGDSLYFACIRGNRGMADLLLACGISPNPSRAPWLDTPLGAAIRSGNDGLVTSLLVHGAQPFLRTGEGQAPLHLAIALRHPSMVASLLKNGASANTPFVTPVRPAFLKQVKAGSMRYVLKEDRNVTPLMLAAASGEIATTAHLLAAGAKKDVATKETRYWPINFASNVGDVRMMRVILGRDPRIEERVIVVSLSEQRARVYNEFGEEIYSTKVSTGKPGFQTPTGEFAITDKNREWTSTLYHASMPFFQRLSCADFGLHQGVVPGYAASHGCIRVPEGNAQKLFSLTQTGDRVKIVP